MVKDLKLKFLKYRNQKDSWEEKKEDFVKER